MMSAPSVTLRTVTSGGALDQFLPDPQGLDISAVFSDTGTISIKYPSNGVNFNLLGDDVEIAVILNGVEILPLRSKIEQTEGDDASDDGGTGTAFVWTFTARTLMARLQEAVVYPPTWPTILNPPNHSYVAATAGSIMLDLITAAQSRGALLWLSTDFTSTHDSAGATWASTVDLIINVGTKYYDVLQSLIAANGCEAQMSGRKLQLYNDNTLGTDHTTGATPVIFNKGRDMKTSPRKRSTRDLSTTILAAGNNNIFAERTSSAGIMSLWGRREEYANLNNVGTVGQLDVFGDALLATANVELLEITHELYFQVDENPQPIRDFTVGDWAWSDVGNGLERHRIKQWTLSLDTSDNSDNFEGSVILNDLVDEQLSKVEHRLTALETGSWFTAPGGTVDLGKTPGTPSISSTASSYYLVFNQAYTIATVNWAALTINSDGSTIIDLLGYNVRWQYSGDTFWRKTIQVDSSTHNATFDAILPGHTIGFQVQAYNSWGRVGAWSATTTMTTATDTAPPVKPSSPTVTAVVGTLRVEWNGLDYLGAGQVADFVGVQVHISNTGGGFTPSGATQVDFLNGFGATATTISRDQGLVYGTQYWVKLVAIDSSGNVSAASDTTTGSTATLTQLVTTEIGSGQVGLGNTVFSDVGNLVDDGNWEVASWRATRTALLGSTHLSFDNTTASVGTWSLTSNLWSSSPPTEDLYLQQGLPVKPGEVIFGAMDIKATSTTTGIIHLNIQWFNAAGAQLDATGAVSATNYQLSGMEWAALDNAWHQRVSNPSGPSVAPPNVATMNIMLRATTRSAGQAWVDAIEVRRQVDTLLIQTAAITTAKIANLAVNDAKISDLSVGKLTVGTLAADITVAARIKTANTGARVELNSSGLQAYNSSGTQTVSIAAASGIATITGEFQSGLTGDRVIINPSGAAYPTIQFWPTSGSNASAIYSRGDVFTGEATLFMVSGNNAGGTRNATYEHAAGVIYSFITNVSTGAGGGGEFQLNDGAILLDFNDNSGLGASLNMDLNGASLTVGASTSAQVQLTITRSTRIIYFQGKWYNYINQGSTPAIYAVFQIIGVFSSSSWSYGATQSDGKAPLATLYNPSAVVANCVTSSSSTGFTFGSASNTTSTSRVTAWVYGY